MRAVTGAVAAALLLVASASASVDVRAAAATGTVEVDLAATRQVIDGFGSSNRVWSDPHLGKSAKTFVPAAAQAQILTAVYRTLGLTRVRNVLEQGVQQSPNGPFNFSGKLGDAHVAFVKQARRYGLRTFFPGPVYLEPWMTVDNPGQYVDWAMAMLRRWRAQGLEPALYAPLNEPVVAGDYPPKWLHDVVLELGSRLRKAGFKTKLVIPDDENAVDSYTRAVAILSDPQTRQYVGAIAFHIYRDAGSQTWLPLRRLATQYRLPLWMTEYNDDKYQDWDSSLDWAVKMHNLLTIGSVNAVDYIFAFFGNWVGNNTLIRIEFDDGAYRGFRATPLYYMTGHYSRYIRPGFLRVDTRASGTPALVSAYTGNKRLIIVALNPGSGLESVRLQVRNGKLDRQARVVRSSSTERWKALTAVPVRSGQLTANLPPRSITTFVVDRLPGKS
jgi:O-glycosyl hydrolase